MKEALICFIIAVVLGSIFNTMKDFDPWGTSQTAGTPANAVPQINEQSFDREVLKPSQPVLVEFYSDDVPGCKSMVPAIAEAVKELSGMVKVVRMDASECPQISVKYGISKLPDSVMFKQGQKVDHYPGEINRQQLVTFAKIASQKPVITPMESMNVDTMEEDTALPGEPEASAAERNTKQEGEGTVEAK